MQTDYDKFVGLFKELAIPAFYNAPLEGPKAITVANNEQGNKAQFNFDKDGKYTGVTFL